MVEKKNIEEGNLEIAKKIADSGKEIDQGTFRSLNLEQLRELGIYIANNPGTEGLRGQKENRHVGNG